MTGKLALLLRAVNVGGTGKLAMAELKAALADLGYEAPKTLGAAGSAVVGATAAPAEVEARLEAELKARFDLATEVFVRTHGELAAILAANPFDDMARERPSGLVVVFLKADPDPASVSALQARIDGPEAVAAGPKSLYVAYPNGQADTKLTPALFHRTLGLPGTGRNWNTVGKLAELTAA